ncbi:transglycosylase SLT domain-containing protein [Streptomyces sp. NPDC006487]|uniref:transglycosylase SLT domain-containing protein n=1 Tax=Streptomyces sp. NPDC006487 TaxID=3364748 RepID=UPI0036C3D789
MPSIGKHRRPKNSALMRRLAAAGTGIALPVIAVGTVNAATPSENPAAKAAAASAHQEAPAKASKAPGTTAKTNATAKATAKAKSGHRTHVVRSGETLEGIARTTHVSWQRLYAANKQKIGPNPNTIHRDTVLTIPGGQSAKGAEAATSGTGHAKAQAGTQQRTAARGGAAAAAAAPAAARPHGSNLDGWIRQSLDIMRERGIPGSYNGILRNVMRESAGNPGAINNWDSNAKAGIPSKGLLQVIDPTFRAYHVQGTAHDPYDPVANIVAASNYAASRYGSIDNVHGAY